MLAAFYPTKKALKESVGKPLAYGETSMCGPEFRANGKLTVVGPSAYQRKWFAQVTMVDGKISKVS